MRNSKLTNFVFILEPVGSVAPNVNLVDKTNLAFAHVANARNLLCLAQAYPMPNFR